MITCVVRHMSPKIIYFFFFQTIIVVIFLIYDFGVFFKMLRISYDALPTVCVLTNTVLFLLSNVCRFKNRTEFRSDRVRDLGPSIKCAHYTIEKNDRIVRPCTLFNRLRFFPLRHGSANLAENHFSRHSVQRLSRAV